MCPLQPHRSMVDTSILIIPHTRLTTFSLSSFLSRILRFLFFFLRYQVCALHPTRPLIIILVPPSSHYPVVFLFVLMLSLRLPPLSAAPSLSLSQIIARRRVLLRPFILFFYCPLYRTTFSVLWARSPPPNPCKAPLRRPSGTFPQLPGVIPPSFHTHYTAKAPPRAPRWGLGISHIVTVFPTKHCPF